MITMITQSCTNHELSSNWIGAVHSSYTLVLGLNRGFVIAGIYTEQASKTSPDELEKKFGQSPVFIASTLLENGGIPDEARPASLLKEAIQVISCGYEDKTDWGKEVRRKKFKVLKTFH